jgi:hypothetical protein
MESIGKFISTLLSSRQQAHIFHWQAKGEGSFAAHKALNEYYDEIVDLTDELVESYQGRYGIIYGYSGAPEYIEDSEYIIYFEALAKYVEGARKQIAQDSYIQNQIDEIVHLIETTKYKLQNLR